MIEHLMTIEFETAMLDSDDEVIPGTETEKAILFNTSVISEEKVRVLIENGMYEWDKRVVVTTPVHANNLKDRI